MSANMFADLASHFKFHYFLCAAFLLPVFLFIKESRRVWVLMCLLIIFINLNDIWPYIFTHHEESMAPIKGHEKLRILSANVNVGNSNYKDFIKLIRTTSPDILIVQELSAKLEELLRHEIDYKYIKSLAREDAFGIGVYSKVKLNNFLVQYTEDIKLPFIKADVNIKKNIYTLYAIHTLPPGTPLGHRYRNLQLSNLGDTLSKKENFIVVGDLNTTMYSSAYKSFIQKSNLSDPRRNYRLNPTWPSFIPLVGIPIDHVLYKGALTASKFSTVKIPGSDHRGLLVELNFINTKN